jgi:excisionase family DNA binding protein
VPHRDRVISQPGRAASRAPRAPRRSTLDAPPAAHVDLLTVSEAAEMLRVSDGTIRNWITAGSIPYIQLPPVGQRKQYRIPLQGLLGSLEGNYDLRGALREQNERMRDAGLSED